MQSSIKITFTDDRITGSMGTDHNIHSQNTFSRTDQWEKDNSIYFPSTSLIIQLIQLNIQAQKAFQTGAVLQ